MLRAAPTVARGILEVLDITFPSGSAQLASGLEEGHKLPHGTLHRGLRRNLHITRARQRHRRYIGNRVCLPDRPQDPERVATVGRIATRSGIAPTAYPRALPLTRRLGASSAIPLHHPRAPRPGDAKPPKYRPRTRMLRAPRDPLHRRNRPPHWVGVDASRRARPAACAANSSPSNL